jgi:hypothetical protein
MTTNLQEPSTTLRGVIDSFEADIAVVLVGENREPWDFPMAVVPENASTETVLILERWGRTLRVIDVDVAAREVDVTPEADLALVIEPSPLRASRHLRYLRKLAGC